MKFLAVLLLAGFALAAAVPLVHYDNVVSDERDDLLDDLRQGAEDQTLEDLKQILKERYQEVLDKIKDAIEKGKDLREDYFEKAKEIAEKLKDLKVDIGNKAKELIEKLKVKAKDYWKKLLEKLQVKNRRSLIQYDEEEPKTELGKKLREHFDEIISKVKEAYDNGKLVHEETIEKLKQIRQKLNDIRQDISDHAKQMIEKLKAKAGDYWNKILNKLKPKKKENVYYADQIINDELVDKFNDILAKLKDAFENRKNIAANYLEQLKDVWGQMKEKSIPMGERAKEMLEKLSKSATGFWKKIFDRITGGGSKRSISYAEDDIGDEVSSRIQEKFEEIIERIKDAMENRRDIALNIFNKMKELYQEMKEKAIPMGEKAKEMIQKLREKATGFWKLILDRINFDQDEDVAFAPEDFEIMFNDDEAKTELGKELRKHFDEILEKLRESLDQGKGYRDDLIEKLKEIRGKLQELKMDITRHAKDMLDKLKDKIANYWRNILEKLKPKEKEAFYSDNNIISDETVDRLKEKFNEYLEKLKDAVESGKGMSRNILDKLNELREEMRERAIPLGEKARDMIDQLKEKAQNFWRNLLDRLNGNNKKRYVDDGESLDFLKVYSEEDRTELGQVLRKHLDEILESMKDALEQGKQVKQEWLDKMDEIRDKLRELRQDIGERAKELIEKLKAKAKDYWKKILERLQFKDKRSEPETELGRRLKDEFEGVLEKLKDAMDKGKELKQQYLDKLEEIKEQLKDLKVELSKKAKDMVEKLKEKAVDYWRNLLEKLKPQSAEEVQQADIMDVFNVLRKLKKLIKEKFNADDLKEKVEKLFGKGSEFTKQLFDMLREKNEKTKQKVLDWIDRVLDEEGGNKRRSIKDYYERVKQFFRDLNIDLKEKFVKFGDWVKVQYEKGLDKGKDRLESVKEIAKKFLDDSKKMGKEVAEEALEFFREYKKDLGVVYDDIKEKVKDIVKKEEVQQMDIMDAFKIFNKLKDLIKEKFNADDLKERVEKLFGKGSEFTQQLFQMLREKNEKTKQKILDWIDRVLDEESSGNKRRSIKDYYERVKQFFRDLNIDLKEKFVKFGDWVKVQYEKGLDKGKDRLESVKEIAKKFLHDSKKMGKEVAEEALEFFREYKNDLGVVYDDIKEKVRDIVKKEE